MSNNQPSQQNTTIQQAGIAKNLIQVGRDYINYVRIQADLGNWSSVIISLGIIILAMGGFSYGVRLLFNNLSVAASPVEELSVCSATISEVTDKITGELGNYYLPKIVNGLQGQDGRGIDSVSTTPEGDLTLTFSDNTQQLISEFRGKDGKNGVDGKHGKNGIDGKNGEDGKDGINGKNGKDGEDGKDGINGKNGKNGREITSIAFTKSGFYFTFSDGRRDLVPIHSKQSLLSSDR